LTLGSLPFDRPGAVRISSTVPGVFHTARWNRHENTSPVPSGRPAHEGAVSPDVSSSIPSGSLWLQDRWLKQEPCQSLCLKQPRPACLHIPFVCNRLQPGHLNRREGVSRPRWPSLLLGDDGRRRDVKERLQSSPSSSIQLHCPLDSVAVLRRGPSAALSFLLANNPVAPGNGVLRARVRTVCLRYDPRPDNFGIPPVPRSPRSRSGRTPLKINTTSRSRKRRWNWASWARNAASGLRARFRTAPPPRLAVDGSPDADRRAGTAGARYGMPRTTDGPITRVSHSGSRRQARISRP
jgi:hypothetical protein